MLFSSRFQNSFYHFKFNLDLHIQSQVMKQQLIVAPIGIDLGSFTSKISVAKRGGVEVITNEANFRETPCVVGYGPTERHIGQSGQIKMKSNFKDTVTFPSRFLGLTPDYPFLRAEQKFCPAKCIPKDDKLAFQVKYQGQAQSLYPEQVFAAYLNKLRHIVEVNNFESKSAVVAVPTYYTQQERKAVLNAAKIAELNVVRLINESTAIALDYGIFRKKDLDATPRNVLFIDFGHSKLSVFVCSFTDTEMNVLEQEHCRHAGCRDLDYHLYEFYRGVFEKSSGGCDLSENRKAVLKLMEAIEKQRKVLSGNLEHDLSLEYLMEENDLHYTMKREQFEKLSEPIFAAISEVLDKIKTVITQKKINIHSIELVGGGSRIPSFISLVEKTYGMKHSRTLNSSESVARGCGLMAAIKSPLFKVADYTLNQKSYYGIKFYWNFVDGNKFLGLDSSLYPEKQGKFIYEAGAKVPTSKTVKFTRKEAIEILIEYQPIVNGFKKHIGYFVTKPQNPKEETFGVSFKIKFTEDGLVTFEECALVEEWFEETKIPKKKKEEKKEEKKADPAKPEEGKQPEKMEAQEEEFEIKKTKKEKYTQIKFESNTFEFFSPKDIETFFTIESTMHNQDKLILQTYERKNQLESMIYAWKQKLQGNYKQFAKEAEIPEIIKFLETQNEWLYSQGQNSTRGIYNERIAAIKNKVAAIAKRYDNFHAVLVELKNLEDCFKFNTDFLNSLDKKYEHITPEERQEGYNQIGKVREWVINCNQQQKTRPKYEELALTTGQIKDKIKETNQLVKKIMGKAAPPPPPKEEKKEEKKEEGKKEEGKKEEKKEEEKKGEEDEKMIEEGNPAAAAGQKMEVE